MHTKKSGKIDDRVKILVTSEEGTGWSRIVMFEQFTMRKFPHTKNIFIIELIYYSFNYLPF